MKLTDFSYPDLNILKIGQDDFKGVNVQFIFWPHFVINGLIVDEALEMFDFRQENIEDQDFGTDYYETTKEEIDHLISLCVGFDIRKVDEAFDIEIDDIEGNKQTLAEVLAAFEQWRKK